jgi:hypothetical protein
MANGTIIQLKDTGLNKVGGSVVYNPVNSGTWIPIKGFTIRGEFTVNGTNNVTTLTDTSNTSQLTFQSNELTAIQAPRFTLQGLVEASDATTIGHIINLGRSKGIKRLTGGLGMIAALPEVATDTYEYVSVLIKNITFSEVVANDTSFINFTIQLEQVR